MEYTRRITGKKALLPPLGLLTVAALLPADDEVRLVDMNVEPLTDEALQRADVVFLSAMQIQRESYHEVIRRAHALGKTVVVGGPYVTTDPESSADADCVVIGEAEELVPKVCADLRAGKLLARYEAAARPDVKKSPIPRFDLLRANDYQSMGVQFSRGCPFNCEFCDIIEIFGRVPRTKTPAQLTSELEAVRKSGFGGTVFVVDDNFIGNKGAAMRMLPELATWMEEHKHPFALYTEASVNLASEDKLIAAMVKAGFTSVFLGIETPSEEALLETQKRQNMHLDLSAAVEKLTRSGLEVMAGFIVGFDADDETVFARQLAFIEKMPIPLAMVGILTALPSTQLWRRLEKEGRLRTLSNGNVFGRTNFETRLPEKELLLGYAKLLGDLYSPRGYFARCERTLDLLPTGGMASAAGYGWGFALKALARSVVYQGVLSRYRGEYWKFLARTLRKHPRHIVRAMSLAVKAEHMIRYTRDDVLPALRDVPLLAPNVRATPAAEPALVTIGGLARRFVGGPPRLPAIEAAP